MIQVYVDAIIRSYSTGQIIRPRRLGLKKSVSKIVKGKVFQRIIMINNLVGLKADFIKGTKIILADRISRLYSNSSTPPFFHSLTHEIP